MSTILKTLCLVGTLLLTSFTTLAQPIARDEFSISPLLNGQQIPKVNLQDIKGKTVDLAELTQQNRPSFLLPRRLVPIL